MHRLWIYSYFKNDCEIEIWDPFFATCGTWYETQNHTKITYSPYTQRPRQQHIRFFHNVINIFENSKLSHASHLP